MPANASSDPAAARATITPEHAMITSDGLTICCRTGDNRQLRPGQGHTDGITVEGFIENQKQGRDAAIEKAARTYYDFSTIKAVRLTTQILENNELITVQSTVERVNGKIVYTVNQKPVVLGNSWSQDFMTGGDLLPLAGSDVNESKIANGKHHLLCAEQMNDNLSVDRQHKMYLFDSKRWANSLIKDCNLMKSLHCNSSDAMNVHQKLSFGVFDGIQ